MKASPLREKLPLLSGFQLFCLRTRLPSFHLAGSKPRAPPGGGEYLPNLIPV
ncbi:hypothetical protein [Ktedonobacter robiniae]|uniref:hypothetical protein n=1 Tax=Ktedonobacter robiniae TaxID=2778365 RepID=UPI00191540E3|nr:hypothetical protein [Ktedonobacter robiniae]